MLKHSFDGGYENACCSNLAARMLATKEMIDETHKK